MSTVGSEYLLSDVHSDVQYSRIQLPQQSGSRGQPVSQSASQAVRQSDAIPRGPSLLLCTHVLRL
jgi:hypothetical protein